MNTPLIKIQDKIDLVTKDLLKRKPNVEYTITINIWNDGTFLVQAKHNDGEKFYISMYHQNNLTYDEFDSRMIGNTMMLDGEGNEYYRLVDIKK
jgi:hypothetical protein